MCLVDSIVSVYFNLVIMGCIVHNMLVLMELCI